MSGEYIPRDTSGDVSVQIVCTACGEPEQVDFSDTVFVMADGDGHKPIIMHEKCRLKMKLEVWRR